MGEGKPICWLSLLLSGSSSKKSKKVKEMCELKLAKYPKSIADSKASKVATMV